MFKYWNSNPMWDSLPLLIVSSRSPWEQPHPLVVLLEPSQSTSTIPQDWSRSKGASWCPTPPWALSGLLRISCSQCLKKEGQPPSPTFKALIVPSYHWRPPNPSQPRDPFLTIHQRSVVDAWKPSQAMLVQCPAQHVQSFSTKPPAGSPIAVVTQLLREPLLSPLFRHLSWLFPLSHRDLCRWKDLLPISPILILIVTMMKTMKLLS